MAELRCDRQQANFEQPAAQRMEHGSVRKTALNRKWRPIVGRDHAGDLAVAHRHEINIAVVKTIDENAAAVREILANFFREGSIIQAVDLLKFSSRIGLLKDQSAIHGMDANTCGDAI